VSVIKLFKQLRIPGLLKVPKSDGSGIKIGRYVFRNSKVVRNFVKKFMMCKNKLHKRDILVVHNSHCQFSIILL
jgi:hypothetical protein